MVNMVYSMTDRQMWRETMADGLKQIYVRSATKAQLRRVKADVEEKTNRAVSDDDALQVLLRHWLEQPVHDAGELLTLEVQHG